MSRFSGGIVPSAAASYGGGGLGPTAPAVRRRGLPALTGRGGGAVAARAAASVSVRSAAATAAGARPASMARTSSLCSSPASSAASAGVSSSIASSMRVRRNCRSESLPRCQAMSHCRMASALLAERVVDVAAQRRDLRPVLVRVLLLEVVQRVERRLVVLQAVLRLRQLEEGAGPEGRLAASPGTRRSPDHGGRILAAAQRILGLRHALGRRHRQIGVAWRASRQAARSKMTSSAMRRIVCAYRGIRTRLSRNRMRNAGRLNSSDAALLTLVRRRAKSGTVGWSHGGADVLSGTLSSRAFMAKTHACSGSDAWRRPGRWTGDADADRDTVGRTRVRYADSDPSPSDRSDRLLTGMADARPRIRCAERGMLSARLVFARTKLLCYRRAI